MDLPHPLAGFDAEPRLYRLEGDGPLAALRVEAWVGEEALDEPFRLELCCLGEDPRLAPEAFLGRPATLVTRLPDGREHRRSGRVDQAIAEDCDGALARWRLVVRPWPGLLSMTLRSQVWQARTVVQIVDSLLARHAAWARWRWTPCVAEHLARAPRQGVRPYTVQYRESDLDFLLRLLAEDGIGCRTDDAGEWVLFADSRRGCFEDMTSARAPLAFQHAGAQEGADTLQALQPWCRAAVEQLSTLGHHEEVGQSRAAALAVDGTGGRTAARLEGYDAPGAQAFTTHDEAAHALRLVRQAVLARRAGWSGQGVVRSFTAGSTIRLAAPLADPEGGAPLQRGELLLTRVRHVGVNNLPASLSRVLLQRFGPEPVLPVHAIEPGLLASVAQRGYANRFEAIRADTPWGPLRPDADGLRTFRKPAPGLLLATVVGPDGSTAPQGADEVHTDRLGRIRIRYEFQGDADNAEGTSLSSCWVPVQQPLAGSGGAGAMGTQWTPRIGHEVVVMGLDGDIDRPVVVCSLYNGRGEGGEAPTPGGQTDPGPQTSVNVFGLSDDARPAAQGNTTGGASPAWHGGSAAPLAQGGQNNAAALSGHKAREFGGRGFNQLVHDDTPRQERLQLASTQHASQLNLGHLIHQADNHRGSFRGLGFEARTDAYGAWRAAHGLLLSTYLADWSAPSQEDAAGLALAQQYQALAQALHAAAQRHQTVALSGLLGSFKAGASVLDAKAAPIPAWVAQAQRRQDSGGAPAQAAPVVSLSARAGIGLAAAQDVAMVANENLHLSSSGDQNWSAGAAARLHAGQAIGLVSGAMQPGTEAAGTGLTLAAGAGDVELQAQDGPLQVAALQEVTLQTVQGGIDFAAAKRIVIATSAGAALVIENGDVEFVAPGRFTVRAGRRSFVGPASLHYRMPPWPHVPIVNVAMKLDLVLRDVPGPHGVPLAAADWRIVHAGSAQEALHGAETLFTGCSDAQGQMVLDAAAQQALHADWNRSPGQLWVLCDGHVHRLTMAVRSKDWTEPQALHQALDASGYSDTLQTADAQDVNAYHAPLARRETGLRHGQALLNQLKQKGQP